MDFQKIKLSASIVALIFALPLAIHAQEQAASLYIAPASGTYAVGDTVTLTVYINTHGVSVNAIEALLSFSPDKLQVVSPSSGKSVIDVWIGQPEYSNAAGTISFRGAIPNPGLNVSEGMLSTITFRVKSTGRTHVAFFEGSKVLLNDGLGTNVLKNKSGAILNLVLPAPLGPQVVSPSHPDQSKWYSSNALRFEWSDEHPVDGYSYLLDENPLTIPDDIAEEKVNQVFMSDVPDGSHYFHIKSRRGSTWGGTTHFALKVDKTPPAEFRIKIEPGPHTSVERPIIEFLTTDRSSGVSYYEVKVSGLTASASSTSDQQQFFIESASPYIPQLTSGRYMVTVRAVDEAGNSRESNKELTILQPGIKGYLSFLFSNLTFLLISLALAAITPILYLLLRKKNQQTTVPL